MSSRQTKLLSTVALAAGIAFITASADAQYLTRPHYYQSAPILHPNARAAYYDAQASVGGGVNVLPTTTVAPMIDGIYDPYDDNHSVYGCCGSARNNERIGLVGAGGGDGR